MLPAQEVQVEGPRRRCRTRKEVHTGEGVSMCVPLMSGPGLRRQDSRRHVNANKPPTQSKPAGRLRRAKDAKREAVRKASAAAQKDASLVSGVADWGGLVWFEI